jgi:hypothetical protein
VQGIAAIHRFHGLPMTGKDVSIRGELHAAKDGEAGREPMKRFPEALKLMATPNARRNPTSQLVESNKVRRSVTTASGSLTES